MLRFAGQSYKTNQLFYKMDKNQLLETLKNHNQFSANIKMYNHNSKTRFESPCLRHLEANNLCFNLIIVHFYNLESCLLCEM